VSLKKLIRNNIIGDKYVTRCKLELALIGHTPNINRLDLMRLNHMPDTLIGIQIQVEEEMTKLFKVSNKGLMQALGQGLRDLSIKAIEERSELIKANMKAILN
jgi:hypothetical protein